MRRLLLITLAALLLCSVSAFALSEIEVIKINTSGNQNVVVGKVGSEKISGAQTFYYTGSLNLYPYYVNSTVQTTGDVPTCFAQLHDTDGVFPIGAPIAISPSISCGVGSKTFIFENATKLLSPLTTYAVVWNTTDNVANDVRSYMREGNQGYSSGIYERTSLAAFMQRQGFHEEGI